MKVRGAIAAGLLLTGVAHADARGLRLTLECDKDTYAPREPVVVSYWIENRSDQVVSVPDLTDPTYGWIQLEVATGDGAFGPYHTGELAEAAWRSAPLAPGRRLSSQVILATNVYGRAARMNRAYRGTELFPFTKEGRYRIRASYPLTEDGKEPLASNTLEIKVRPAAREEDAALTFFADEDELAAALGADGSVKDLPAAVERWEGFVARFGRTPYASFVRLHLASTYLRDPRLASARPDLAIEHLRAVVDRGPRSIADDALLDLAKAAVDEGRPDEAKRATAELLRRFPASERAADAKRIAEGLDAGSRSLKEIYGR